MQTNIASKIVKHLIAASALLILTQATTFAGGGRIYYEFDNGRAAAGPRSRICSVPPPVFVCPPPRVPVYHCTPYYVPPRVVYSPAIIYHAPYHPVYQSPRYYYYRGSCGYGSGVYISLGLFR